MRRPGDAPVITQPQVLIVDDDDAVLTALVSLLAPRLEPLFRVETASSGEEALELLAAPSPAGEVWAIALIISDEKMPGMTGNDLLVALCRHELHRDGGRIMVTGYAGLPSAKRAINEAEVDKYFAKPWDTEGAMIPAVSVILARFVRKRGLGTYLLSDCLSGDIDLDAVLVVRREWWLYVVHFGEIPDDGAPDAASFLMPGDESALHIVLTRRGADEKRPAAAIRLRPADAGWQLDQLAFWPEDANDATEILLLRAALLEARRQGAAEVRAAVPRLRRSVYESLGFAPEGDQTAGHELAMVCRLIPLPTAATVAGSDIFTQHFMRVGRLCGCEQTGCPDRDYAAARRSYFCPLDIEEGRVPSNFPLGG
ncbi:MAG: response regulator [bacterium]|nr:response regulator [bacterium]